MNPAFPPLTLALYQPDIPQNAGTILRMCACLGFGAAIIEPAGFPVSDRHFRRAGMDYLDHVTIARHASFAAFDAARRASGARLILMTTKASLAYTAFHFEPGDILLFGRESAGAPPEVHASADARLAIPLRAGHAIAECRRRRGHGRGRGGAPDQPYATARRRRSLTSVNSRLRGTPHFAQNALRQPRTILMGMMGSIGARESLGATAFSLRTGGRHER